MSISFKIFLPETNINKDIQPYYFSVNCSAANIGDIGFCNCNSCGEDEGDCDSHNECQDGLVCGSNNCLASLGFDLEVDCCYDAIVGDDDFCTTNNPCGVDEGDCDSNNECKTNLICDSCPVSLGFASEVDCCLGGSKFYL